MRTLQINNGGHRSFNIMIIILNQALVTETFAFPSPTPPLGLAGLDRAAAGGTLHHWGTGGALVWGGQGRPTFPSHRKAETQGFFAKTLPAKPRKFVPRDCLHSPSSGGEISPLLRPAGFFSCCSALHLILPPHLNGMKIPCVKMPCFLAVPARLGGGTGKLEEGTASAALPDLAHPTNPLSPPWQRSFSKRFPRLSAIDSSTFHLIPAKLLSNPL